MAIEGVYKPVSDVFKRCPDARGGRADLGVLEPKACSRPQPSSCTTIQPAIR